jgi:hypothetical protein
MLFNIDISSDSDDSSYWEDDTFIECCCPENLNESKDLSQKLISKLNIKIKKLKNNNNNIKKEKLNYRYKKQFRKIRKQKEKYSKHR